jgi:YD repeat-containing protein
MSTIAKSTYHAGIFKRFVASLIDGIILIIVGFIAVGNISYNQENIFTQLPDFMGWVIEVISSYIIGWLYFALLESSPLQATFGKKLLEIVVTDKKGNRVSFAKASLRHLNKSLFLAIWILGGVIFVMGQSRNPENAPTVIVFLLLFAIGFLLVFVDALMVLFTSEKQSLHDIIARCYVVNDSSISANPPWKSLIISLVIATTIGRIFVPQIYQRTVTNLNNSASSNPQSQVTPTPQPTTTTPPPSPATTTPSSNPNSQLPAPVFQLLNELTLDNLQLTEIETPRTLNICNAPLQLLKPDDGDRLDTDSILEWSSQGQSYIARLRHQGQAGRMRVVYPNDNNQLQAVDQTMQLYTSAKGYVFLGFNPIDVKTQAKHENYKADNLITRRELDGSISTFNCDDAGRRSSVLTRSFTTSP